jgi:hypothetical protein
MTGSKGVKGEEVSASDGYTPQNSEEMVVVRGQEGMYEVCMKLGLEVDPEEFATFILLCREDVRNEVVPVEEPSLPENIQDIENRGDIGLLNPRGGRAVGARDRRGRRCQLQLLVGKREDRGG